MCILSRQFLGMLLVLMQFCELQHHGMYVSKQNKIIHTCIYVICVFLCKEIGKIVEYKHQCSFERQVFMQFCELQHHGMYVSK